jgi:RND family efflux transporter MFP subunit
MDQLAARLRALAQGIAGPRRPVLKLSLGLGVLSLALAALVPVAHRVDGEAVLRGSVQRVVLAPVDGFVATAPARPGDVVKAGGTLATLDDQSLQLEVVKRQSEYDQVQAEYREAMSLLDSARVTTLRAGLDRAGAELSLAEENLARSHIPAPIDGIVVSGDLSQSLGAPVQRGQTLFEIAPLETWRVSVQVDERDIGPVAAGQLGALRLEADPGRSLPLVVERVTPVARVAEGRNLFEVEARLVDAPANLRPGMQGIARIEVGEQRLLSALGGGLADWLRLRWWALGLGSGT